MTCTFILGGYLGSVYAAAPKTGSHYILVRPEMSQLMPAINKLQQDVQSYLIKQNVLLNVGLSYRFHYSYENADFTKLAPHISLLPVPSTMNAKDLIPQLRDYLQKYTGAIPSAFAIDEIVAFLPNPQSQKVFIVARTPSNVSFGFKNLSKYLEDSLGIQNPQPWFLGHISLGTLTATQGQGFTQKQISDLNAELKKYKRLPVGSFAIDHIILSEYKGSSQIIK